jgi:hypothetical protein
MELRGFETLHLIIGWNFIMKKILMISEECERWGPARLPQPLSEAGLEIGVLCSNNNPLSHSSFVARHFGMAQIKSWRRFGIVLGEVMAQWNPDLIIPCDETVVVMLHYFLKNKSIAARYLDHRQLDVVRRSIGYVENLDAMVFKYHTRLLAESLGLSVPEARRVNSLKAAENAALGFKLPVYMKKSFSWAGQGSISCTDLAEVKDAFQRFNERTPFYKKFVRRLLGRDWFPVNTTIEVQTQISGESVMYSVAALDGKVLGGFFASRMMTLGPSGPSTIVKISENNHCRMIAEKMVAEMGASGFLAFDFICCSKTGNLFLIECNPRPNQICHLGKLIGSDLCKMLAAALNNEHCDESYHIGSKIVSLFPQEWLRDQDRALDKIENLDIPANDLKLFGFMLDFGRERGHSIEKLSDAIH